MKPLVVNEIEISQDSEGRFSLNDLHRASGGEKSKKPALFMQNGTFKKFVEILKVGEPTFKPVNKKAGRYGGGTWVCKELVYKYAMWVNPEFELRVIRTFDSMMKAMNPPGTMAALNELTAKIESDADVASFCGKELNKYKKVKRENEERFAREIATAQLSLGFKPMGE
jgi:hypothetical protein